MEDEGVNGRIILKWVLWKWDVGVDWVALDKDTDRWHVAVNSVINLRLI